MLAILVCVAYNDPAAPVRAGGSDAGLYISKKDALVWFSFFAQLPEDEEIGVRQQEIIYAALAQIERAEKARINALKADIKHLKTLKGRTDYVGPDARFPKGCVSCLLGTGLSAVRKTNKCNMRCKFCYDYGEWSRIAPIGDGLWDIGGTKYYEEDIDLLLSIQKHPTGIAYVYLEPFMEIKEYYGVIRRFAKAGVHQHLYTNGTLCTQDNLKALGDAGLDELRFNLGASGCADSVIANIAEAKKHIGQVGVETPMTKETFDAMLSKKRMLLDTGLDFINCAELHLNANNIENFLGENMYATRLGYISPICSRELTLKLMRIADDENWGIVVHDCSNDTKFARDINLRGKENAWFGASSYGGEFDAIPCEAFLPILRDDSFPFIKEEELPHGYRPGETVL